MASPDDLFADLLPPQQAAPPTSGSADDLFADLVAKPNALIDAGKGFGSGLVKGAIGTVALPATVEQLGRMGINKVSRLTGGQDAVSPEPALPSYQGMKSGLEKSTGYKLYEPQTTIGKYASAIGEFAPGMLFPVAGAARGAAQLGARAVRNVALPAVGAETAGQLTHGTSLEPYARVAGGLLGGMAPQIAGRTMSPLHVDPARAQAAANLEREGVQVTAGQLSGNDKLRYAESMARATPFSGNRAQIVQDAQQEAFTRATLRRAGIDAPRATPEVINDAFQRIGHEFQTVSARVAVPLATGQQPGALVRRVDQIANGYERVAQPSLASPLPRAIAGDLATMAQNNAHMTGDIYLRWRSELGAAARGTQDPATRTAIYDIQHALDVAATSSLRNSGRADMVQRLTDARQHYRNMITIERAATGAGEAAATGLISPAALKNATVTTQTRRNYARGQGDFPELARSGVSVMSPLPNSGTAQRAGVQLLGAGVGGGLGAIFGGGLAGGGIGAALGHMAPAVGQGLVGRAVMSRPMQAYLSNQLGAQLMNAPRVNRAALAPGLNAQANQ